MVSLEDYEAHLNAPPTSTSLRANGVKKVTSAFVCVGRTQCSHTASIASDPPRCSLVSVGEWKSKFLPPSPSSHPWLRPTFSDCNPLLSFFLDASKFAVKLSVAVKFRLSYSRQTKCRAAGWEKSPVGSPLTACCCRSGEKAGLITMGTACLPPHFSPEWLACSSARPSSLSPSSHWPTTSSSSIPFCPLWAAVSAYEYSQVWSSAGGMEPAVVTPLHCRVWWRSLNKGPRWPMRTHLSETHKRCLSLDRDKCVRGAKWRHVDTDNNFRVHNVLACFRFFFQSNRVIHQPPGKH